MFFDDDLIDAMRAAPNPDDDDDVGAGSHAHENSNDEEADENLVSEEETKTDDLEVEPETASIKGQDDKKASATPEVATSSAGQSRRRRRGSRGGASGSSQVGGNSVVNKRWRSGQIPAAPIFEGDIEADPYCLRHYKRRLTRWVMITKEYLPANEQALRAREQLRGEAELELEETPDSRYDDPDGINKLLADLEQSFGERELFRQGGVIREFESISRLQGESVTQFVRRFRLLERKLQDNRVPEYPQEARVIKLLDGLRLDDRATSALLLAAGNRYDMKLIQEAIRIQYPPGMSVTGIPKGQQQKRGKGGQKWNALQTAWEADEEDDYGWDWSWENDYNQFLTYDQFDEYEYDHEYDPDVNYNQDDVDYEYDGTGENHDHSTQSTADANSSENTATESSMFPTLLNAVNALTVTSKRLADITRARGFYNSKGSGGKHGGKSKGKSGSKSKGGGHGGKFGKGGGKNGKDKGSSTSGGGKSKGKFSGKGKPSQTPSKINLQHQQQRLQDATCLGCGSPDHWINDCPKMNRFSAQIATAAAGVVMDAEGNPQASSWMTSVGEKNFQLPAIVVDEVKNEFHHDQAKQDTLEDSPPTTGYEVIPSNPEVLIQYANQDAFLMIADTGCQRQVAGRSWHNQRHQEISPLQPLRCPERCTFSFGPNEGVPSRERYVYPAGLGGVFVSLGISVVDSNAPALFSRPAFTKLGAIPNLVEGKMYYQALQTESKLYLSPCGHLAIRIDEWPSEFAWPPLVNEDEKSDDVWSPDAVVLEPVALQHPVTSARSPPHAISSSISGYSSMAAQLEADDEPCSRIRVLGPASSDVLCQHGNEAFSAGPNFEGVLPSSDCNNYADVNNSSDFAVQDGDRQVPKRSSQLPSSFWSSWLWSSRREDKHLRHVRDEMVEGDRQRPRHDSMPTKGVTKFKDSSVQERVRHGQDHRCTPGKPPQRKFLKWLFPTVMASACLKHVEPGGGSVSEIIQSQVQGGTEVPRSSTDRPYYQTQIGRHVRTGDHGDASRVAEPAKAEGPQYGCGGGELGRLGRRGSTSMVPQEQRLPGGLRSSASARGGSGGRVLSDGFSADRPMMKEDRGSFRMKPGTQKRLSGNCRQVKEALQCEARVYEAHVKKGRTMRRFKNDVVEVFAGMANITAEALGRQLRAIQPIDAVHGIRLDVKEDFKKLTQLLVDRCPFLVIWEIRCDPWSNIQHLNYTAEELASIRESQYESIKGMCDSISFLKTHYGVHFLLENPWGTPFWKHPEIVKLMNLENVKLAKGSMCNFGLVGRNGHFLKKDTGWLSDLSEVLNYVAKPCEGNHQHEECLGGNAKRAQVYTRQLAKAVIDGLVDALINHGDERWIPQEGFQRFNWTCGANHGDHTPLDDERWLSVWSSTAEEQQFNYEVLYLDIIRDEEAWRPVLQEAQLRLEGKTATSAIVRPGTAFFAHIQDLVPWTIHQAQIVRNPKVRRIPQNLMSQKPITHRAAILRYMMVRSVWKRRR